MTNAPVVSVSWRAGKPPRVATAIPPNYHLPPEQAREARAAAVARVASMGRTVHAVEKQQAPVLDPNVEYRRAVAAGVGRVGALRKKVDRLQKEEADQAAVNERRRSEVAAAATGIELLVLTPPA